MSQNMSKMISLQPPSKKWTDLRNFEKISFFAESSNADFSITQKYRQKLFTSEKFKSNCQFIANLGVAVILYPQNFALITLNKRSKNAIMLKIPIMKSYS